MRATEMRAPKKFRFVLLAGLILFSHYVMTLHAQSSVDIQAETNSWLLTGCEVGQSPGLSPVLLANKADAALALASALQNGPGSSLVSQVAANASASFNDIQSYLSTGNTAGLSSSDLSSVSNESLAEFVAEEVDRFVQAYKGRAVLGLGLLQAQSDIGLLTPIANDSSSPLQLEAQTALRNFGDLNFDGKTDCTDLAIVRASFGKTAGQLGFDPRADINMDGVVNLFDLSFVAKQLPAGTTCP
jgi:hypothetical protein